MMHTRLYFMLPSIKTYVIGVILTASVFLFSVLSAFGDTFSVNVVAYTQNENFYGIDASGNFVVDLSNSLSPFNTLCGGVTGASSCFATYYVGQQNPVYSTAAPTLNWDNGAACTAGTLSGVCNNGHQLLGGYLGNVKGVWTGTDPLTDFLTNGTFDGGFINALGDAVFINGENDTLVSVVDTPNAPLAHDLFAVDPAPVPEPPSVWLVGLGMMVSAMTLRKRRNYGRVRVKKITRPRETRSY